MTELKHIVALSGGKDSTAMALRLAEVEPRDYIYVCTPTGDELPEMTEHWNRLECLLRKPLVRLSDCTLDELIQIEGALPNWRMRFCTRKLKIEPALRYYRSVAPCVAYVGLRADEDIDERGGIYGTEIEQRFPMREWGWGVDDVWQYLFDRGVHIPKRSDCARCYDQRLSEWYNLWRDYPQIFAAAEAQEELMGATFRGPNRDTWPASLKGLRGRFENGDLPRGATDQTSFWDDPRYRKCRVCSL